MTDLCYLVPVAVQAQSSAFILQFLPSVQTDSNRRSYLGDLSFGIQQGWSDGKKIYQNFYFRRCINMVYWKWEGEIVKAE